MTGNRLWMIAVGALTVAAIALGWVLGISPVLARADAASQQRAAVQLANDNQRVVVAGLAALHDKLPELRTELKAMRAAIPGHPDLDDFLDQLQTVAQQTGVTISSFGASEAAAYGGAPATPVAEPVAPAEGAEAPAADPAAEVPAAPASTLFTVPITIGVTGPPEAIMAFTNAIQLGERFFLVTGSTFSGASSPATASGSLTGFVFVVVDPSGRSDAEELGEVEEPEEPAAEPEPEPTPTPTPTEEPAE